MTIDIQFVGSRVILIEHTPQWKIDHALDIIKQAYSGELKFHINDFIPPPKKYKRDHLSEKWLRENRYDPAHDHHTCKTWRRNLNKIRDALKLLYKEDIIDGYHVDGSGTLHIKWFVKWKQPVREIRSVMRTAHEQQLQRADVFARKRYPELDQFEDIRPVREPYNKKLWRVYEEAKSDHNECIYTRMMMREGQADMLHIISEAYVNYDLDTLYQYNAPLSCKIEDKPKAWRATNYDEI